MDRNEMAQAITDIIVDFCNEEYELDKIRKLLPVENYLDLSNNHIFTTVDKILGLLETAK
jgi:hypothetical protein